MCLPDVLIDFTFLFNFCRTFVHLLSNFCPPIVHLLSTFCPPFVHFCSFCYLCLPNFLIEFTFLSTFCLPYVLFPLFRPLLSTFRLLFPLFFNVFSTLTVSTYFLLSPFLWLPDVYFLLGTLWLRAGVVADLIVFYQPDRIWKEKHSKLLLNLPHFP